MDFLPSSFALLFSVLAGYSDLKKREIPDALNYGALFLALGLALFLKSAYFLLFTSLPFLFAAFLFSYFLYRVGAWAGGDVKFFTALAGFYPLLAPSFSFLSLAYIFLASVALLVPLLLLLYAQRLASHSHELLSAAQASLRSSLNTTVISYVVIEVLAFVFFYFPDSPLFLFIILFLLYLLDIPFLPSLVLFLLFSFLYGLSLELFLFLFLLAFAVSFFSKAFGILSQHVLRHRVSVSQLKEGMIPAETVVLQKKKLLRMQPPRFSEMLPLALQLLRQKTPWPSVLRVLSGTPLQGKVLASALKARGLSRSEIQALKRAGLKYLVVKESLPFAPLLATGFFLAAFGESTWLAHR